MNLSYIGDALDHWKGSLFEFLEGEGLLHDFLVDPMASDRQAWEESDFELLARLLRVRRGQILDHRARLTDRTRYFAEIEHKGDIFLDPDTGIATGRVTHQEKYVQLRDLWALLGSGLNRLIVVYQHVRAQKCANRVDKVVGVVSSTSVSPSWCSYESGSVAMLFFSLADYRIANVASAFRRQLGRHSQGRIRVGNCRGQS